MAAEEEDGWVHRRDAGELAPEEWREIYERDQLLWVRLESDGKFGASAALESIRKHAKASDALLYSSNFFVENASDHDRSELTAKSIFGGIDFPSSKFYASAILQGDEDALESFFREVAPIREAAAVLPRARYDNSAWIFLGINPPMGARASASNKRAKVAQPMRGRPEHVDEIDHDGTWHVQLAGSKTWYLRPDPSAPAWQGRSHPPVKGKLRLHVEAGDLIAVNTNAWFHSTEIDAQSDPSISYARDFYLEDDVFAKRIHEAGDVVLLEHDIPNHLPRSHRPNCDLAELENGNIVLERRPLVHRGE